MHIVVTSCVLRIIKLTRWLCPSTSQLHFREVPMSSKSDGVGVGLFQTCSVKSPPLTCAKVKYSNVRTRTASMVASHLLASKPCLLSGNHVASKLKIYLIIDISTKLVVIGRLFIFYIFIKTRSWPFILISRSFALSLSLSFLNLDFLIFF